MPVTPLLALVGRAFASIAHRAWLYALIALLAIAAQWLVVRAWPAPESLLFSGLTIGTVCDALTISIVRLDVEGITLGAACERALERLWAVIAVNLVAVIVTGFGLAALTAGDIGDRIVAVVVLLMAVSLVYVEVIAVVADEERAWWIVPHAIGTSVRTVWSGGNLTRSMIVFAAGLVSVAAQPWFEHLLTGRIPNVSFWSTVPLGILLSVPVNVLATLMFFDAHGYAPQQSSDE